MLSSVLLPPCIPLLCLVCLGLSILVLPRTSHATFISTPFILPFTKVIVKIGPCFARTTLDIALPFHRELLITAFQLQFLAGLHPFHLHCAFLICLSECHIKRIRKVRLWHLLISLSSYGLLSCQRGRLDWLTVCVCDKSMLTSSHLCFPPVLKAVGSSIIIFFF